MDCSTSVRFSTALSFLTATSQQHALRYLAVLESRNYATATLSAFVGALRCLLRYVPDARKAVLVDDLAQTNPQDISAYVSGARQAGLQPSTINNKLSLLSAFFEFLREEGLTLQQPILRRRHRLLAPKRLPKPMSSTDLTAFFKVIDSVRDRLIFLLMLRCGLRVSEVCALTWNDIDFDDGTARVNNGKGQVDRIVYFSPDVEQALQTWRAHQATGKYLFPSRIVKGASLKRAMISVLMNQYLEAANLTKHYSPHCLRHTFATELINGGVPLEVLKELLGHHSLHVTLCYTQLYDATKRQQYDQAMTKIEKRHAVGGR
jgi:site-specific recombinase XerD